MATMSQLRHFVTTGSVALVSCLGAVALTLILVRIPGLQSSGSGNAGQAFGAAAAAASVYVLFYVARSFRQQAEEFRMRRDEMAVQYDEMRRHREEARVSYESNQRIAEATVRGQHLALMKIALQDPLLAEVWPNFGPEVTEECGRQYQYANLIISFECMAYALNYVTDDEALETLSYLFGSPIIREFWNRTRAARNRTSLRGGRMREFYNLADLSFRRRSNAA